MIDSHSIIFFGTGDFTLPVLQMLAGQNLKLVVTTDKDGAVARYATKAHIPLLVSQMKSREDIAKVRDIHPTVGVLASYGSIVSQEVIDIFPEGILNIHPSLLPRYKGPSPIQTTILNGDQETGVSIIRLDDRVDHGPIAYQITVALNGHETTDELKKSLFKIGSDLVEQILKGMFDGRKIEYLEQDARAESFTKKIANDDGKISLADLPAPEVLDRMIRAYYPHPGVYFETKLGNDLKRVKLLPGKMIQVEGKRVMTYADFINGYQDVGKDIVDKLR